MSMGRLYNRALSASTYPLAIYLLAMCMHQMNTRALARRTEMRGVGYNRAAAQRCGNNSSRWWMECDPILERTS